MGFQPRHHDPWENFPVLFFFFKCIRSLRFQISFASRLCPLPDNSVSEQNELADTLGPFWQYSQSLFLIFYNFIYFCEETIRIDGAEFRRFQGFLSFYLFFIPFQRQTNLC